MRFDIKDLRHRFIDGISSVSNDLGYVSLGAAAIFLARAFPSSAIYDFDIWMFLNSMFFCAVGLLLRRRFKE